MVVGWNYSHPGFGCWLSGVILVYCHRPETVVKLNVSFLKDISDDIDLFQASQRRICNPSPRKHSKASWKLLYPKMIDVAVPANMVCGLQGVESKVA
ncbi:hypothetical protein Tco_0555846 [Tanacetum coccineum]